MARHRGRAERAQIVQRLERSGLSIAAFARHEGLSQYSVRRWSREAHAQSAFAEVVVTPARAPSRPIVRCREGDRRDAERVSSPGMCPLT
jgi:transposase-like protein